VTCPGPEIQLQNKIKAFEIPALPAARPHGRRAKETPAPTRAARNGGVGKGIAPQKNKVRTYNSRKTG